MAQINKPDDYFNTKLYSGTGSSQAVTGVGFQPDWIWFKSRTNTENHNLFDAIRGSNKIIQSSTTGAEASSTALLTSFDSDGFTVNTDGGVNGSGQTYASWNWLGANGTASNTDGSITSTVSANTTSGFSIVSWTGTGADATVGHGLSQAPTIFILKNRTDVSDWRIGQVLTSTNNMTDGNGYYMELNDTKASSNPGSATTWGATPTAPTSSVFTVGSTNAHNGSGDNMIAYCFAEKKGYSKFGSYTGNGNADGTFIYTGFKPAWVMIKQSSGSGTSWNIWDNKRLGYNTKNYQLEANTNAVENTSLERLLITSNGFKCLTDNAQINGSGNTYIYMAFAENPLVGTNNIPATAR